MSTYSDEPMDLADYWREKCVAIEARLAEAERLLGDIIGSEAFEACECGSPDCRTTKLRAFLRATDSAFINRCVCVESKPGPNPSLCITCGRVTRPAVSADVGQGDRNA